MKKISMFILLVVILVSISVVNAQFQRNIHLPIVVKDVLSTNTPTATITLLPPTVTPEPTEFNTPEPTSQPVYTYTPTNTSIPTATLAPTNSPNCHASYPDFCIPPPPPDLNCSDVAPHKNFTVRWDVPDPDPHHFDGNMNGIGCE